MKEFFSRLVRRRAVQAAGAAVVAAVSLAPVITAGATVQPAATVRPADGVNVYPGTQYCKLGGFWSFHGRSILVQVRSGYQTCAYVKVQRVRIQDAVLHVVLRLVGFDSRCAPLAEAVRDDVEFVAVRVGDRRRAHHDP